MSNHSTTHGAGELTETTVVVPAPRGVPAADGTTGEYAPAPIELDVPRVRPAGRGTAGIERAAALSRAEHLAAVRAGEVGSMHSWELVTAVDGPGTRMTVFLAGCPLRCLYCHNPDTWKMRDGEAVTAEELLGRIKRYRPIFRATGGGVTFSGGEPLMQPAFLGRLLAGAKEMGIHTTVDTSGFLGDHASDELLRNIDLVLLDIKAGDDEACLRATKQPLAPTLRFAERLAQQGIEVWVRFVLVPGLTDAPENVEKVADIAASIATLTRVEVLPFHQMGRDKWDELGEKYDLENTSPPSKEQTEAVREVFRRRGLTTY